MVILFFYIFSLCYFIFILLILGAQKCAQKPRGNTRTRGFCLTIFDGDDFDTFLDWHQELDEKQDYIVYGHEVCPETKKKHIQAYVYIANKVSWQTLKKKFPNGTHIELAKGSAAQNRDYCTKEGNFKEWGTLPQQGRSKQLRGSALLNMSNAEIAEEDPRCHRAYIAAKDTILSAEAERSMWQEFMDRKQDKKAEIKKPFIVYITGKSGSGKTFAARSICAALAEDVKEIAVLDVNNDFFSSSNFNARILHMEEFRPGNCRPSILLRLMDRYGAWVYTKGSQVFVRPQILIIDSIVHPSDLYKKEENNTQFQRRLSVIYDLDNDFMLIPDKDERIEWMINDIKAQLD